MVEDLEELGGRMTDRINVRIERHEEVGAAVENFQKYIKAEVLILASKVDGEQLALGDELTVVIEVKFN